MNQNKNCKQTNELPHDLFSICGQIAKLRVLFLIKNTKLFYFADENLFINFQGRILMVRKIRFRRGNRTPFYYVSQTTLRQIVSQSLEYKQTPINPLPPWPNCDRHNL